jgi:hypothetical protein
MPLTFVVIPNERSARRDLSSIPTSCHDDQSPRGMPDSVHPDVGRAILSGVGGFANCATAQFGLRSDCIGSKGRSSTNKHAKNLWSAAALPPPSQRKKRLPTIRLRLHSSRRAHPPLAVIQRSVATKDLSSISTSCREKQSSSTPCYLCYASEHAIIPSCKKRTQPSLAVQAVL